MGNLRKNEGKAATIRWILVFAAAALLLLFLSLPLLGGKGGTVAVLSVDGEVQKEIDLEKVEEPYTLKILSEDGGYNLVRVAPGEISVEEADCPDLVCVHAGKIGVDKSGMIVCLPHKLIIEVKED